jgi:hypothetical protein
VLSGIRPSLVLDVPIEASMRVIYGMVAEALGLAENTFSLRYATASNKPSSSLARRSDSANVLVRAASSGVIYLETATAAPYVLAWFDPTVSGTRFMGRMAYRDVQSVTKMLATIRERVGLPDNAEIAVYANGSRISDSGLFSICGNILIAQNLSANVGFDPSARPRFVSFYKALELMTGVCIVTHEFPRCCEMSDAIPTLFSHFGASEFRMLLPRHSSSLTVGVAKKFVVAFGHLELGEGEQVVLYECLRPMAPSARPIVDDDAPFVPKTTPYYAIYFRVRRSGAEEVRLVLSRDGRAVDAVREVPAGEIEGERVLRISMGVIDEVLGEGKELAAGGQYRLDGLPLPVEYRFVNFGAVFNRTRHVVAFGQPFLFELKEGESEEERSGRLLGMVTGLLEDEEVEVVVTKNGTMIVEGDIMTVTGEQRITLCVRGADASLYMDVGEFFRGSIRFLNS